MKNRVWGEALIGAVAVFMVAGYARDHYREDFPEKEEEIIRRTLDFSSPAGMRSLSVDNIEGSIQVTGYDGSTVQVEVAKTIRARSKDDVALAKQEVELKISEKENRIDAYVDGPFRSQNDGGRSRRRFYRVNYDFRIKAPRDCNLDMRTVNNGDIQVDGVSGRYDIENVNGKIVMNEVSGAGWVRTINGSVTVTFNRNPAADCSFGSLNGNVEVAFPRDFSADCWFKTFNGSAYTDFELRPLPQPAAEIERRGANFVYKSNRFFGGRIGNGGPQIKFDTFNGDIHVTSR